MANIKLDFSKMKHVYSDKNYTTLAHPSGHTIKLAHSALTPDNQKALSALSGMARQSETPEQADQMKHRMADGGKADNEVYGAPHVDAELEREKTKYAQQPATINPAQDDAYMASIRAKASAAYKSPAPSVTELDENGMPKTANTPAPAAASQPQMAKGGMASYADGTTDAQPPMNLDPNSQNPAPETGIMDKAMDMTPEPMDAKVEKEHFRHLYNDNVDRSAVANRGKAPTPDMFQKTQAQKFDFQSGSAPKDINVPAEQQAEIQLDKEHAQNQVQQDQTKQQQDAFAQAKANLGLGGTQVAPIDQATAPGAGTIQPPAGAAPPPTSLTGGMPSPEDMLKGAYQNSMAGATQQAAALGQLGQNRQAVLQKAEQTKTDAMNRYQTQYDALNQERLAHIADIQNGYVDPNKYWIGDANGNGSHSKIAAGLGMILAGFNPSNKPNAAIDFLKYQMDQNINAQVNNLGAKKTMLEANLRQFGNMRDAMDMTRLMQSDIVANQLDQASAKAATPLAKAAALSAKGQIQQQMYPLSQQLNMRRAMMSYLDPQNPNPSDTSGFEHMLSYMRTMDPKQASEMQQLLIPGVGIAKVPVSEGDRTAIADHKTVNALLNEANQISHMSIAEKSQPSVISRANTLHGQLIGAIKNAQKDGVYKESEANFLTSQVGPSPDAFLSKWTVSPKLEELQSAKQLEYNNILQKYGIANRPLNPQQAQQPQIKTVNGIRYMRGANGQAVPIK